MVPEPSKWQRIIEADPEHSRRFIERFRRLADAGHDLVGEARLADVLAPRNARILDAGCGTGRHAALLQERGHTVVGVDVDPELISEAEATVAGPTFLVGDLAELDLPARGVAADFDVVLCAGNVMGFLAPSTRVEVLRRFGTHLSSEGRVALGFGAGRGYEFRDFFSDAAAAGLRLDQTFSTWDLRPFAATSEFLVAILGRG